MGRDTLSVWKGKFVSINLYSFGFTEYLLFTFHLFYKFLAFLIERGLRKGAECKRDLQQGISEDG